MRLAGSSFNNILSFNTQRDGSDRMSLTTGAQVRAARAMLRMEQEGLAAAVGVAVNTIRRIESFDGQIGARLDTVRRIQRALEEAGIVFIAENGGGSGVRLRTSSKPSTPG